MGTRNEIERGLEWWATLSREDKSRWLQCAATPDEIDADLRSSDPDIRAAAGIASVGDAWTAFQADAFAPCQFCAAKVPAEALLRHEATHSPLEREIARLRAAGPLAGADRP